MNFPVLTQDGETVFIVEKKILDESNPQGSEVLLDAEGNCYRSVQGAGVVEAIDAPELEDNPANRKAAADAERNAKINDDQAAHAEAVGPVGSPSDPLTGQNNVQLRDAEDTGHTGPTDTGPTGDPDVNAGPLGQPTDDQKAAASDPINDGSDEAPLDEETEDPVDGGPDFDDANEETDRTST